MKSRAWVGLFSLCLLVVFTIGCSRIDDPRKFVDLEKARKTTVDDVKYVKMETPLPYMDVPQPLYPDRDREKIQQLIDEVKQAKPLYLENLIPPRRSYALDFVLNNGKEVGVTPVWTCTSTKDASGMTSISCHDVENRVLIYGLDAHGAVTAASEPLYHFLTTQAWQDWMPPLPTAVAPKSGKPGEEITLAGNSWLTDQVELELTTSDNNQKVVWSHTVTADHGHFEIKMTVPKDLPPGYYWMNFKGDNTGSRGLPFEVKK